MKRENIKNSNIMANLVFQKEKNTIWSFLFGTKITLSAYDDGTIIYNYNRPKFWIFKRNDTIELAAKDVQFFVMREGFLRIPGMLFDRNSVYLGGATSQFRLVGFKRNEVSELRNYICDCNSPIGEQGEQYSCWNLCNPISWIRKEFLYTTPSGVRYECGKNMSFIPWEQIHFFYDYTTRFTFGWDIFLYGEHFIQPKARVHGKFVSEVKSHLKNDAEDGKKINVQPSLLWRIIHPFASRKPIVIMTDKSIFHISNAVKVLPYDNISEFKLKKEHWYSIRGVAYIMGYIHSIREDQDGQEIIIEKENISVCMWRKIKKMIEDRQ